MQQSKTLIPVTPFQQLTSNWDQARTNASQVISLVDAGSAGEYHSFEIPASTQLLVPASCAYIHGYMVCSPNFDSLQMLLISDEIDESIKQGATQVPGDAICTLNYNAISFPSFLQSGFLERIEAWQNHKDNWANEVVDAGNSDPNMSVVRVFTIPVSDWQNIIGSDAQVFLALKSPELVETSVEVILATTNGEVQFYDISTPIPPYPGGGDNFGLLS